jgi:hypothetical protein
MILLNILYAALHIELYAVWFRPENKLPGLGGTVKDVSEESAGGYWAP